MDNNEFNRRIRYALRLDDADAVRLIELGGQWASLEQVAGYRCKEEEEGYSACPDDSLLALLDGLILDRRGPPPERPKAAESPAREAPAKGSPAATRAVGNKSTPEPAVNNNLVLKQLRIALALRSDDIYTLMVAGGGKVGKTEVGAFFRSPDARNYRRCGDQAVRWFLAGLAAQREQ